MQYSLQFYKLTMVAFISATINNDENKQFKYHPVVQIVEFRILFYDDTFNRL